MSIARTEKTVGLPHEPGTTVTIRRMLRSQKREAALKHSSQSIKNLMELGGPEVMQKLQAARAAADDSSEKTPTAAAVEEAPKVQFDQDTVLRAGIVSWSYGEPVSAESIDALDDATATFLFSEIVGLSDPKNG